MLKKNIIYQIIYQILILVVPLILSKYVTNIFAPETLGVYSSSYSLGSIFLIFGLLGIQKYGTRVIAKTKNNELELRKTFWSLFYVHVFLSLLSIAIYFILAFNQGVNSVIYLIQGIYVASVLFDITWLFYGLENFKSVVLRNTLIKIIEVILILCLVKTNNDLWIYTLIMASSVFFGQFVMLPTAIAKVKPIKINFLDIKPHFAPLAILSISVIATSFYSYIDKVFLGFLSPKLNTDSALYDYSEKIVKIPLAIITSIGTVMLPRISSLVKNNDATKLNNIIGNSITIVSLISVAACFGIASISNVFVSLWYGKDYLECGNAIIFLSPIIIFISLGDVIRSQYLIPKEKDIAFTISVVGGTIINLILNLCLIPIFGLNGAIIGTIVTEFIICLFQFFITRKDLPILNYFLNIIPFLIFGILMFAFNKFIEDFLNITYLTLCVQIVGGGLLYLMCATIYLAVFKKNFFNQIMSLVFKRRRK